MIIVKKSDLFSHFGLKNCIFSPSLRRKRGTGTQGFVVILPNTEKPNGNSQELYIVIFYVKEILCHVFPR